MKKSLFALNFVTAMLLAAGPTAAQVPSNPLDYSRTQAFTYTATGMVLTATTEPDNPANCSVTTYDYDAQGNRIQLSRSNCAGATGYTPFTTRTTAASFPATASQGISTNSSLIPNKTVSVAAGVSVATRTSGVGQDAQTVQVEVDPRFGLELRVTDPNGLVTKVVYDNFGRPVRTVREDGTSEIRMYCFLSGAGTASNTTDCPTPGAGEAPTDAVRFTHIEPRNTADVKMGPFVRTYVDRLGRVLRTVTQSYDGASQPAAYSAKLIAADTQYNAFGAAYITSAPYFLSSQSSSTTGNSDVALTMTTFDDGGRVAGVFKTDPNGAGPNKSQTVGTFGTRLGAWTTFDHQGMKTVMTNDKGRTRTEERDALHRISRITDDAGAQVAFKYDAFGNLLQSRDALQNSITASFDYLGNRVSLSDPDKGTWAYAFNALGEQRYQRSPNQLAAGTATTQDYDQFGRLFTRSEPEFVSTWVFDNCANGVGKLCQSSTTADVIKTYAYDSYGRLSSQRTDIANSSKSFAVAYGYDASTGKPSSYTYPTGLKVTYGYSSGLKLLEKLVLATPTTGVALAANTVLAQTKVYGAGRVEQVGYANGVTERTGYLTGTNRMSSKLAGVGAATDLLNQAYSWDSLGNVDSRIDNNGDGTSGAVTETFYYDPLNRLARYRVDGAGMASPYTRTVSLTYNALGMLQSKSDVGSYTYGPMGGAKPHTPTAIAGTTYQSDANGNITSASAGPFRSLAYTSFDLPNGTGGVGGPSGSPLYTWQYDERHARISQTRVAGGNTRTTWYLHPDNVGGLSFETEANTSPASASNRHFLVLSGQVVGVLSTTDTLPTLTTGQTAPPAVSSVTAAKVEFWHKDHLGSLASTSDQTGALQQRYAYDPFGKRRFTTGAYDTSNAVKADWSLASANGTGRGFTGHEELDDIGLVHMNGRLYSDTLGLFLQADPHLQDSSNLQNYNRYSYVLNNPLNATDPSGFDGSDASGEGTPTITTPTVSITCSSCGPLTFRGSSPGNSESLPSSVFTYRNADGLEAVLIVGNSNTAAAALAKADSGQAYSLDDIGGTLGRTKMRHQRDMAEAGPLSPLGGWDSLGPQEVLEGEVAAILDKQVDEGRLNPLARAAISAMGAGVNIGGGRGAPEMGPTYSIPPANLARKVGPSGPSTSRSPGPTVPGMTPADSHQGNNVTIGEPGKNVTVYNLPKWTGRNSKGAVDTSVQAEVNYYLDEGAKAAELAAKANPKAVIVQVNFTVDNQTHNVIYSLKDGAITAVHNGGPTANAGNPVGPPMTSLRGEVFNTSPR